MKSVGKPVAVAAWMIVALVLAPLCARAQGRSDTFNTETIQVHPITVLTVDGQQYIAAVNTPDGAVEIYDTDETLTPEERFVARVRTGMEPGSLLWVPELSRLYVSNALSDAVTAIHLEPGVISGLAATVEGTRWVGDEPMALTYLPFEQVDGETGSVRRRHSLVVAHHTQDGFSWIDALTLQPITFTLLDAVVSKGDIDGDGRADEIALKSPRDVAVRCGRLFVLGEKGGNAPQFDFDLYSIPILGTGPARDLALANSTNFSMAFASNDDLFIVGGEALNRLLREEDRVAAATTGFVKSTVTMVRDACGARPRAKSRDVNLRPLTAPQGDGIPAMSPARKDEAMAQLTGVAVFERPGQPTKVFFTAFGSDQVGILEPEWGRHPFTWPLRHLAIEPVEGTGNPMAGPRGLAIKAADPSDPGDPGARLYVLNRLDNSITILDPEAERRLEEFPLRHDPTPLYIRRGRPFLYDARLGNGFNSCASCHVEARTDGLAWDLGNGESPRIDPQLKDQEGIVPDRFPADKNFMVTQSLQGLLNYEVEPEMADLFTNAPYHWRGDRSVLADFNPAFASLLGGEELSPEEMAHFEEFLHSVQYPPNPRQRLDRIFSGRPFRGDAPEPAPTGAQAGLFTFHTRATVEEFACAHCHALPEGSQNKIPMTLELHNPFNPAEKLGMQPVEAPALRGLFQKEARLARDGSVVPEDAPISGLEGLSHTGFLKKSPGLPNTDFNRVANIGSFLRHFFAIPLCGRTNRGCADLADLAQFIHEFDWGVAPLVGLTCNVDLASLGDELTPFALGLLEGQAAEANVGLAVQAWIAGAETGFWWDPREGLYLEIGGAGQRLSRDDLLESVVRTRDRLVFIATPLGSERRVGAPDGRTPASEPGSPAPTRITLLPMVANTAYAAVPTLSRGWAAPPGAPPGAPSDPRHGGFASHTARLFERGILASSRPRDGGFGVALRWEPARRLRLAAEGVEPGARLLLFTHDDAARPSPPDRSKTPEDAGQVALRAISLPIHPTGLRDADTGLPIYETAAELDAREFLRLILGGPHAPGVAAAWTDHLFELSESPLDPSLGFDADGWNWHYIRVVNPDGQAGDGGWQRLRLE